MNNRTKINLAILRHLKQGTLTPTMVKHYSGWGGLSGDLAKWPIQQALQSLMTQEEINSAKRSTTSAYYTHDEIVKFIYQVLDHMGEKYERVLEPAAGVGCFLDRAIERKASEMVTVELDHMTSRLLKVAYPHCRNLQGGFETFSESMLGGKFDLIIGNPPFGTQSMEDKHSPIFNGLKIHHYFLAKSIALLKEGGMLAMVLPKYCLDNGGKNARGLAYRLGANLYTAYRLPDNCFKNAKVTVDLVFFQKAIDKRKRGRSAWCYASNFYLGQNRHRMNQHFIENPAHVLGRLTDYRLERYNRMDLTCKNSGNLKGKMEAALKGLPTPENIIKKRCRQLSYCQGVRPNATRHSSRNSHSGRLSKKFNKCKPKRRPKSVT